MSDTLPSSEPSIGVGVPLPTRTLSFHTTLFETEKMNGPDWIGIALTGKIPSLLPKRPRQQADEALNIIADISRTISRTGCANFAIMLGFWAPSASWLLYVRATELSSLRASLRASSPPARGSTWIEDIRRKIASYVPREHLEEMEINNRYSIPWHYPHNGKWMHLSLFVVYRGVPFVVQRDGKLNVDEWKGVIALKEHDEKYKGRYLSPTRLTPSEAVPDIERALKELVRSKVGKVVRRLSR
ncbi:hypothetical protein BJX62DRAFT_245723 [Aspergillus germanicus]